MSKTPRTDAAANESIVKVYETSQQLERELYKSQESALDMRQEFIKLESELGDMRKQFTDYVKAEDAWRDEFDKEKSDDLRIEAAKLRKQAKQTLGL